MSVVQRNKLGQMTEQEIYEKQELDSNKMFD